MRTMYKLAKPTEAFKNPLPIAEDWEASNGHIKDTIRLFHSPWHDPVGELICAQPFRMWNILFQRRKSNADKRNFEMN